MGVVTGVDIYGKLEVELVSGLHHYPPRCEPRDRFTDKSTLNAGLPTEVRHRLSHRATQRLGALANWCGGSRKYLPPYGTSARRRVITLHRPKVLVATCPFFAASWLRRGCGNHATEVRARPTRTS